MEKWYVIAAFRTDSERSVAYTKCRTLQGFLRAVERVIVYDEPDYVSIRVVQTRGADAEAHNRL